MVNIQNKPVEILLVEDNPADVEIAMESFQECQVLNHLNVVNNGEDAIKFLQNKKPYQNSPRPNIIFLDLNLPKKNGHEVLIEIKNDPALRMIPVIVLTSSKSDEDIIKSYDLHANCYLTKPSDLDDFIGLTKIFEQFWLERALLPNG